MSKLPLERFTVVDLTRVRSGRRACVEAPEGDQGIGGPRDGSDDPHPERFPHGRSVVHQPAREVWINEPKASQEDSGSSIEVIKDLRSLNSALPL